MDTKEKMLAAAQSAPVGDNVSYAIIVEKGSDQVLLTADKPFVIPARKDGFQTQGTIPPLSGIVEKVHTITTHHANPTASSINCTTYITLR